MQVKGKWTPSTVGLDLFFPFFLPFLLFRVKNGGSKGKREGGGWVVERMLGSPDSGLSSSSSSSSRTWSAALSVFTLFLEQPCTESVNHSLARARTHTNTHLQVLIRLFHPKIWGKKKNPKQKQQRSKSHSKSAEINAVFKLQFYCKF